MGKEIPVVLGGFGEGKKCICDKTIAEIHSMNTFDVRRRITDNIKRFKENIDFIDLKEGMHMVHTSENQHVGGTGISFKHNLKGVIFMGKFLLLDRNTHKSLKT